MLGWRYVSKHGDKGFSPLYQTMEDVYVYKLGGRGAIISYRSLVQERGLQMGTSVRPGRLTREAVSLYQRVDCVAVGFLFE